MYQSLKDLYNQYIPICIDRIFEGTNGDEILAPLEFITPRTNLNLLQQFCLLFDSMLPDEDPPQESADLEKIYIFCLIWSLGGCLTDEDRPKFDDFIKKNTSILNPSSSYYDNIVIQKNSSWALWSSKVLDYAPPVDSKFSKILVPTVDTKRYTYLLNLVMSVKRPAMFIGDSGTAKSVTIFHQLQNMD